MIFTGIGIRFRTTALIALTFSLFLSFFFGISYFSVRGALLDRSFHEVRTQVGLILLHLNSPPRQGQFDSLYRQYGMTAESPLVLVIKYDSGNRFLHAAPSREDTVLKILGRYPDDSDTQFNVNNTQYKIFSFRDGAFHVKSAINIRVLDETQDTMFTEFAILLVIGIGVSIALGFLLSAISLKPLTDLLRAARTIREPASFVKRLPIPRDVRELHELAKAINAILDERDESIEGLRNFTADAAHELRTPLTTMKGEIEVELRMPNKSIEERETLQSLQEEVERLIAIVQDLLYLARMEHADDNSAKDESWSLRVMLEELCSRLDEIAAAKKQTLSLSFDHDAECSLPKLHLQRMFYNVLLNAIQYSAPESNIAIEMRHIHSDIFISFRDKGVGISKEDLAHIFDRFWRAEHSRNRSSGGSGLGLAITRSIADKHDITINITSTPAQGTVVEFSLPVS